MHRRNLLGLIALGAIAPTAGFAQRQQGSEANMGEAGRRYMSNTLDISGVAVATSRLAQERASNPWVKKFANYETAEQEEIANLLHSLGGEPEGNQREREQEATRQLRDLRGERFDLAYLQAQANGHEQLLRVQDDFVRSGGNEDLEHIAQLVRGRAQEHIDLIRTIRDQLQASTARARRR